MLYTDGLGVTCGHSATDERGITVGGSRTEPDGASVTETETPLPAEVNAEVPPADVFAAAISVAEIDAA